MKNIARMIWNDNNGQDIAEYALMLALLLAVTAAVVSPLANTAKSIFTAANACLSVGC